MAEQRSIPLLKSCPNCGGGELYHRRLSSAGAYGPQLLAGLGSFLHYADFDVVVCADCGMTRFFAEPEARKNVRSHDEWKTL
ncbi:MAG TPA: hypothetical protein VMF69_09710 [Gemmataceae bacterium]|nr:hypothetical protein [Gemmataceae bacterium]